MLEAVPRAFIAAAWRRSITRGAAATCGRGVAGAAVPISFEAFFGGSEQASVVVGGIASGGKFEAIVQEALKPVVSARGKMRMKHAA